MKPTKPKAVDLPPLHTVPPNDWTRPNAECIQVVWNDEAKQIQFLASDSQLWVCLPKSAIVGEKVHVRITAKNLPKLIHKRVWRHLQEATYIEFANEGIHAKVYGSNMLYNYFRPEPNNVNWYTPAFNLFTQRKASLCVKVKVNAHLVGRAQRCVSPFSRAIDVYNLEEIATEYGVYHYKVMPVNFQTQLSGYAILVEER